MLGFRMIRLKCNKIFWTFLLLVIATLSPVYAQNTTIAAGIVKDSISGEPLSYVSVMFEHSTIGTMTDDDGRFNIQNNQGLSRLVVSSLGYETKTISLLSGSRNETMEIALRPTAFEIAEVTVRPGRERYSRRNNPAVELIKKVIEHKNDNRIEAHDTYQVEQYEKLSLAFDDFNPNLEKGLLRKFKFVKNYMDTSEFTGRPILTLSVRETLSDHYYRKKPKSEKTIVKAKRQEGIEQSIDGDGLLTVGLEDIFTSINIFDNDIEFLLNRFVSPLSSTLATTYYQYYLLDTLDISGDRCVDLGFVPANSESYAFTGHLYIMLDGSYSVKKASLNTPHHINLNWVEKMRIDQEFKRAPDNTWVPDKENIYANFYVIKGAQQIYAHQFRTYEKYNFALQENDSIFNQLGAYHILSDATAHTDTFWIANRHIPLSEKEDALKDLLEELRKVPVLNALIKTIEILVTGYIPTKPDRNESLFDFGPMNTTFSSNRLEGFRVRAGGMTTANLHPHLFAGGYLAYGVNDRKLKHSLKLTYSFNPKKYHSMETPVNNLTFMHEYDVYTPGQDFLFTSKDNMFVAIKVGEPVTHMQYIRREMLQYEKDWANGLTLKTWARRENNEAAGTLRYNEYLADNTLKDVKDITTSELGVQLRFAPGERVYSSREGKESAFRLSKDVPILRASHQVGFKGILGGDYTYHHTEISAEKRIWLSSFGHIDAKIKAGKVWNQVPFPLLILPNTNQSLTIQPESFTMMRALEFVADEYASFFVTYYLKGWILNRIPVIKWLKLREVVSVNGFYGNLTDKNNPYVNPTGQFQLPNETRPIGNSPYIEASVGLDNILKILRVDYYRRLTYLDEPNIKKGGFRIALRFAF